MSAIVLKIGERAWVAGLRWKSYEEDPSTAEILVDAEQIFARRSPGTDETEDESAESADFYVKRPPRNAAVGEMSWHDVGYGVLADAGESGQLYSVGEALAQAEQAKKWSATYALPGDKYLFIAVSDGSVDPSDHGEIVGDRAVVEAAVQEQAWKEYPHRDYSFEDLERTLREFTGALSRVVFVSEHATSRKRKNIAAVAAAAVLVGVGAVLFHVHEENALVARQQMLARLRSQRLAAERKQMVVSDPLLSSPAPDTLLAACKDAMQSIPIDEYGWAVQSIDCTSRGVTVIWRATGTAWAVGHPPGLVSMDGKHVVWRHAMTLPNRTSAHTMQLVSTVDMLRDVAGQAGLAVKVDADAAAAGLPGSPVKQSGFSGQYKHVSFSLRPEWAPWSMPLGKIPGLRIDAIRVSGFKWSVKGTVYGSPG